MGRGHRNHEAEPQEAGSSRAWPSCSLEEGSACPSTPSPFPLLKAKVNDPLYFWPASGAISTPPPMAKPLDFPLCVERSSTLSSSR